MCQALSPSLKGPGYEATSGHAVGFNSKREEESAWLLTVKNDSGIVTGMLGRTCKRHKTESKYNNLPYGEILLKTAFVDTVRQSHYSARTVLKRS